MHKIDIDDDVLSHLQKHAQPFVDTENSVLRRLLFDGTSTSVTPPKPRSSAPGDLALLLKHGLLLAGDELNHRQPRKGLVHTAIVREDGWIVLPSGEAFAKPSPALKACVGNEINGWGNWYVTRTGQPLQELREQVARRD